MVDIKARCGRRRGADPVVGDALDGIVVVSGRLDRLNTQHAAVRHVEGRVALASCRHPAAALPPVDFRRRVAGRFAEEADDAVIGYALVARRYRHLRRVYRTTTTTTHGDVNHVQVKSQQICRRGVPLQHARATIDDGGVVASERWRRSRQLQISDRGGYGCSKFQFCP